MPTIRVMNWNVQNYGWKKSGEAFGNYDLVNAIAKVVVDNDVDLLAVLEVNTTQEATAQKVSDNLRVALMNASVAKKRPAGEFSLAVLSPNTEREFYAFFIRDSTAIRPVPISGILTQPGVKPPTTLGGTGGLKPNQVTFTAAAAGATGILPEFFPLIKPDLPFTERTLRGEERLEAWPGRRLPVLALFLIAGAAVNRYLPIIAIHTIPSDAQAARQMAAFTQFSILRGMNGSFGVAPVNLTITGDPAPYPVMSAVVLGDFNTDFDPSRRYAPLVALSPSGLGMTYTVPPDVKTHLASYNEVFRGIFPSTKSLATQNFDNIFIRQTANVVAVAPPAGNSPVVDVPRLITLKTKERLVLRDSVQRAAELDEKGFQESEAGRFRDDYANQLAGDASNTVSVRASLLGARLISDHLPTFADITIT